MFDVQIWQLIHHWKALILLLLESAKKSKFAKLYLFLQNPVIYWKCLQKKNVQKIKWFTFFKSPWQCHFKYAKIFANILTWCVIKKILSENCHSLSLILIKTTTRGGVKPGICKELSLWYISSMTEYKPGSCKELFLYDISPL